MVKKKEFKKVVPQYIVVYVGRNYYSDGLETQCCGFDTVESASEFALRVSQPTIHNVQSSPYGEVKTSVDWKV